MNGTLTYSIGTEAGDECVNILAKGVTLPAYAKKNYVASEGQKTLDLALFKNDCAGESVPLDVCTPMASVSLNLPSGTEAGDNIEVIYTAGLNGLLIVTCKCNGTAVEKNLDL